MIRLLQKRVLVIGLLLAGAGVPSVNAQNTDLDELLTRTGASVNRFLDQLDSVMCREDVLQEKFNVKGKPVERLQSSFDYLVLRENQGSEPLLFESRQPVHEPHSNKNVPFLVSNGFATELLIFHPYYQPSFAFERLADVKKNNKTYVQVRFVHIKGRPTPAALQLRGRDYPLSLAGSALIDSSTASVEHINTELAISMEDLGLRHFHTEVDYAPTAFPQQNQTTYWLPVQATIEVSTVKQQWKNLHRFTGYHLFSVDVSQKVKEATPNKP